MVVVSVGAEGDAFRMQGERTLFQAFQRGAIPTCDISPDGSRFLIATSTTERQVPLVLVTEWPRTLDAR